MRQILCLSADPWRTIPTRTQQLMTRMRDAQVLLFEPPGKYSRQPGRRVRPGLTVCALSLIHICGATGFVGSGNKAIPLTDEEIAALGVEKREVVVGYQVGDNVKITDGALESFLGTVEEIDLDRSKVRVVVSMFGRETPVELELDQVEPVQD